MSDTIQSADELDSKLRVSFRYHNDRGGCEYRKMTKEESIQLIESRDAAIRAEEARKQAERYVWISVKNRLPETADHVLLCNKAGSVFVGFYYDKEWTDLKLGLRDPTRWMPMPDPPLADLEATK